MVMQIDWRPVNLRLLGRIRDQGSTGDDEQLNSLMHWFLPPLFTTNFDFGRRKEDREAAGFGLVKGDEEDHKTGILKRTPVVIALHYTTVGLQKALSNVASSTIYTPKKHVIKKQIEKGLKRAGDICNHAALLIGAKTYADRVNYWIVQDSRVPHIHDDGILYIKRPSTLPPMEGNAIYQAYYPLMKEILQPKF